MTKIVHQQESFDKINRKNLHKTGIQCYQSSQSAVRINHYKDTNSFQSRI